MTRGAHVLDLLSARRGEQIPTHRANPGVLKGVQSLKRVLASNGEPRNELESGLKVNQKRKLNVVSKKNSR